MSEILVKVTRGPLAENIHRGDIAVVDGKGDVIAYLGDPDKITYMRSAAKPFQTMAVLQSGAHDYFAINEREIAVMCGSHYAEDFHVMAVLSILYKIGLDERYLQCGVSYSIKEKVTMEYVKKGIEKKRVFHNCSGKHAGMLAMALKEGYDAKNYLDLNNPVQQKVLDIISYFTDMERDSILIGIDGCGTPVHGLPIKNMAKAYMKLTNPSKIKNSLVPAARKVTMVMTDYPEMIAGTGGFCTELMKVTRGKILGKLGADGVYCMGLIGKNIGIALKIEDGNSRVLSCVALETLRQLNLISTEELEELGKFYIKDNINSQGDKIGEIKPEFRLKKE